MAAWEPLLSFDEVKHEMMIEEPPPSYRSMVEWCGRFPQYREEIAESIVFDATHKISQGEPQDLIIYDEDEIVMAQNLDYIDQYNYALEVLRRRELEIPPRPVESLEPFDRQVLEAAYQLRAKASSETIAARLNKTMDIGVLPATTVLAALQRLKQLGLVFDPPFGPGHYRERDDEKYWRLAKPGER
ncbi:MAG TPA: hypothetical protein VKY31_10280, partial [Terriglobia bacterium]|nr:hypothetical protein [Terriglobia bacterium]